MKLSRLSLPVALAGAMTVGCSADVPIAAPTFDLAPSRTVAALDGAPQVAPRYVVVFNNAAPKDFDAKVAALGGTVLLNHALGIAVVSGLDDASAATLETSTGASYVEPQADFQLIEPAATEALAPVADAALPMSTANPAGAILFSRQWNMRQIHADAAWAAGFLGSSAVHVAILDTGIDYMLPDLAGLVDLSHSASFEPVDDYYVAHYFPTRNPTTDLHFHGTNVATQVSSNAWAFAGVTSKTSLMSVKVCSVAGGCHGVIQGILYAIDNGADVINMSLGGWFKKAAYPGQVAAFNKIMNYAKQQGVTIVVAAGNDGNNLDTQQNIAIKDASGNIVDRIHVPSFFATYCDATHVICVSASRMNDVPASYTNYGRSAVDVAAPGGDSGEWVYALCPQTSLVFNCRNGYYTLGVAGTSQATPHVSGLAALMVQRYGRKPSQVKNAIRQSADDVGEPGNDPYFGAGRINVARAVGVN
ncbi:MAG TPA: S8 family serine peptidase [Gemmatimonadaceae bacterium]|nr:S8 family serine peptidase [Gemmatimonadaceae bacterium]